MNKIMKTNYILEIMKNDYKHLTKLLNGEQDFNPINPDADGCFYHLNTLEKFLNGTLEFDEEPTKTQLDEINSIVKLMKINSTSFLYLK